jgi:hypothetical protein
VIGMPEQPDDQAKPRQLGRIEPDERNGFRHEKLSISISAITART